MRPLSVSAEWRDYVLEQLSGLRGVTARSMFGGAGLYHGGMIFGLIDNDQLFFKVDDTTRPMYQERGAKPWDPAPGHYQPSMGYFEVPADVLEDRDMLVQWAREATLVAQRKGAKRGAARDRMAKPAKAGAGVTPAEILKPFTPGVRKLANALRALVKTAAPGLKETGYPGWKAIGYRDPDAGYICGVFPQKDCVRLIFEHGARLDDPDGLLEGGGRTRQVRYVTIRAPKDIRARPLTALIRRAIRSGG